MNPVTQTIHALNASKNLKELRTIRWVETAKTTPNGFIVKTKANSLNTTLTHKTKKVRRGYGAGFDSEYTAGAKLSEPVNIKLPQYRIHLTGSDFMFSLVKEPPSEVFGMVPTYHRMYSKAKYSYPAIPCYGNSEEQKDGSNKSTIRLYRSATSWREKALIAAMFLQSAEPHYGLTHYRTSYAHRLGLVGDEMLEQPNPAQVPSQADTEVEAMRARAQFANAQAQQVTRLINLYNNQTGV